MKRDKLRRRWPGWQVACQAVGPRVVCPTIWLWLQLILIASTRRTRSTDNKAKVEARSTMPLMQIKPREGMQGEHGWGVEKESVVSGTPAAATTPLLPSPFGDAPLIKRAGGVLKDKHGVILAASALALCLLLPPLWPLAKCLRLDVKQSPWCAVPACRQVQNPVRPAGPHHSADQCSGHSGALQRADIASIVQGVG